MQSTRQPKKQRAESGQVSEKSEAPVLLRGMSYKDKPAGSTEAIRVRIVDQIGADKKQVSKTAQNFKLVIEIPVIFFKIILLL